MPPEYLRTFFYDYLAADGTLPEPRARVARLRAAASRYVLFRVGRVRFALLSADIAMRGTHAEASCHYLAAAAVVPARYRRLARADAGHRHYIHLTGSRFGIGPCQVEGEVVVPADAVELRASHADDAWITGTLGDPASLVLDGAALSRRLAGLAAAGAPPD